MNKKIILTNIDREVRKALSGEGTGHDFWHIMRVRALARRIGKKEGADMFAVELIALLHDIADWKFHNGDDTAGPRAARAILEKYPIPAEEIQRICDSIAHISWHTSVATSATKRKASLEERVVQDADRLDALGAIGIARTFAYGGHKGHAIYDPNIPPNLCASKEEILKNKGTSINHFYEKLLRIKEKLNTKTAKTIARKRHQFLKAFLKQFYQEWEGKI